MAMSLQEIYDTVRDHLLLQGRRARKGKTCLYRAPGGLKCAVGCLITDEAYSTDLEGEDVYSDGLVVDALLQSNVISRSEVDQDLQLGLLDKLQVVHDRIHPRSWKNDLEDVAYNFGLTP